MRPLLGPVATVVASVVTMVVVYYVASGTGAAAGLLLAGVVAFLPWISGRRQSEQVEASLVPYLGVIVLNLLLNAARYWSDYAGQLSQWPVVFAPRFASPDVVWFLSEATVPTVLMLAGGYALLRGHAVGRYMAWWTFAYAIVDGVAQFAVEFGSIGYEHHFFLGGLAAAAQIAVGLVGWMQAAGRLAAIDLPMPRPLGKRASNFWTLGFVAFATAYGLTLYLQAGFMPVMVIVGSMIGGLIAWRRTTAFIQPDRLKIVPRYLLMLALFYFHVGEEGLTGFNHAIAWISGRPWSDGDFVEVIGLLGPALWVAGGLGLWLRQPWGSFLVWFMVVGMLLGEPTHHIVFPVLAAIEHGVGYTYFPGMATALFPMIPAVIIAATIFGDHRVAAAKARAAVGDRSSPGSQTTRE